MLSTTIIQEEQAAGKDEAAGAAETRWFQAINLIGLIMKLLYYYTVLVIVVVATPGKCVWF